MAIIPLHSGPRMRRDDPLWGLFESLNLLQYEGFNTVPSFIRVGTRTFSARGPLGTGRWERTRRARERYQEVFELLIPEAIIRVHGQDVHCFHATMEQLRLLDATFLLVPPDHLQRVLRAKPEGFHMVSHAGRGATTSYMGGLNPAHDYPETPYDETRAILITYGALWQRRNLGICPTVLHEIGHVMTHSGNGLSYATFDAARATELGETRVSRNPGAREALCNTYMFFLCYGADNPTVRTYGTGASPQKDRRTRDALRRSLAFTRLPEDWQQRFRER